MYFSGNLSAGFLLFVLTILIWNQNNLACKITINLVGKMSNQTRKKFSHHFHQPRSSLFRSPQSPVLQTPCKMLPTVHHQSVEWGWKLWIWAETVSKLTQFPCDDSTFKKAVYPFKVSFYPNWFPAVTCD